MSIKRLLCPDRLRRVPRQFSWIDQRLVRDRHITRLPHTAQGLYLFLATVADAEGLSFYSDRSSAQLLGMEESTLCEARKLLVESGLIAYRKPLYQVLSLSGLQLDLPVALPQGQVRGNSRPESIGEILRDMKGGPR